MGNNVHELWAEAKALFEQMKGNYVSNNEANFFKNIQYKQEHEITGLNDLLISEYENPYEIQSLVPGLQPLRSFACTHSSLKPSLCFGFQGYIRYGFRLFVLVYALHSVVRPTHAPVFITTLRFIQTIASLKGFDHTIRSITLLVFTPRVLHARQAYASIRIRCTLAHYNIYMDGVHGPCQHSMIDCIYCNIHEVHLIQM